MNAALSDTEILLARETDLARRAIVAAREVLGEAGTDRQVRLLGAIALTRSGLLPRLAAARLCMISNTPSLSPSQWAKAGLDEAKVGQLIGTLTGAPVQAPEEPAKAAFKGGKRDTPERSTLRRFASAQIDPEQAMDLRASHPGAIEGHTIFPTTVVGARQSPRLLVSGHNNPKLGKEVLKGPRSGWPIFHLTLEERATCPRSCPQWLGCYGNAMHMARRHRADAELLDVLRLEVAAVARQYPGGFLVRLHTLGDFFSVEYVYLWGELLAAHPQLHVFGYTARSTDAPEPESRKIARAIGILTKAMWRRFAIRTSHAEFGPERSVVVMKDPERADVVVCPAQLHKSEACATCGLCWAEAARPKTIAFLKHGMKRGRRGAKPAASAPAPAPVEVPKAEPAAPVAPVRGLTRLKPVNGNIVRWSRAYASRGVRTPYLADLFDVDADELSAAMETADA